jgi:hypothetical protein
VIGSKHKELNMVWRADINERARVDERCVNADILSRER